jgi:hypothetical protein
MVVAHVCQEPSRVSQATSRSKFTKLEAIAAVGAVGLIACLAVLAFRGGPSERPADALTGSENVEAAPLDNVDTQVESLALAATGIDGMTLRLIAGAGFVAVGGVMVRRSRAIAAPSLRG